MAALKKTKKKSTSVATRKAATRAVAPSTKSSKSIARKTTERRPARPSVPTARKSTKTKSSGATRAAAASPISSSSIDERVREALAWLEKRATKKTRDGLARYGIVAPTALGVSVADVKSLGKRLGRDHDLARSLWKTDVYEARLLVSFVGDPARLTSKEMDAWCADFDNWAVCDSLCFHLFDRSEFAFDKVAAWSKRKEEFVRRTAFALLACLALHGRGTSAQLARCLPLLDRAATDDRNFVKKAVSWAIRSVGIRSRELNASCLELARKWLASSDKTAVALGREVTRALGSAVTLRRLAKK